MLVINTSTPEFARIVKSAFELGRQVQVRFQGQICAVRLATPTELYGPRHMDGSPVYPGTCGGYVICEPGWGAVAWSGGGFFNPHEIYIADSPTLPPAVIVEAPGVIPASTKLRLYHHQGWWLDVVRAGLEFRTKLSASSVEEARKEAEEIYARHHAAGWRGFTCPYEHVEVLVE